MNLHNNGDGTFTRSDGVRVVITGRRATTRLPADLGSLTCEELAAARVQLDREIEEHRKARPVLHGEPPSVTLLVLYGISALALLYAVFGAIYHIATGF